MTEQQPQADTRPRRWRGWWTWRAIALLIGLPLVFALIAAVLMIDRDITAPTWVRERVQDRAGEVLAGGSLSFGSITINVGSDLHPRIRLDDTVLRDAAGDTLAKIDTISGQVSPRGLLFERAALFQEVELSGVRLDLTRTREGGLSLAFAAPDRAAPGPQSLPDLLDAIEATFERPVLAALEEVRLTDVTLDYTDLRARRSWTLNDGEALLDLDRTRRSLTASLAILGGEAVTTLDFSYASPVGSREATLALDVADARATDIATQSPALGWLGILDAPASASLRTSIDATGALGPLEATLAIGAGALRPGEADKAFGFDGATTQLTYLPSEQAIRFAEIRLATDWGELVASGQAFGRETEGGLPQTLIGQFTFSDLTLDPPGLYPQPVAIDSAAVDLRLRLDPFVVEIGQAVVTRRDVTAVLKGRVTAAASGVATAFDLSIPQIDKTALMTLWPAAFRPGTRGWFARNIAQARLTEVTAGWRQAPGAAPVTAASFQFADADITYLKSHPPITGAMGAVYLGQDRADVTLASGHIAAPQGGLVDMAESSMAIPELSVNGSPMVFDLVMQSTVTAALSLVDLPPFGYVSRANLPVTVADGRARTRVALSVARKATLRGSDVDFDVDAVVSGLSTGIVPNRTLTSDRIAVALNREGLSITGPAALDGVPLRGTFARAFREGATATVDAIVTLTPEALTTFGIGLPRGIVTGRGEANLALSLPPGAPPVFDLTSGLRGLTLSVPAIGWTKTATVPGELTVSGALGQPPRIDAITLQGGGLSARGDIQFNGDGSFGALRMARLQVGDWLNAPVTLRGRGPGRPVGVEVNGGVLDLRRARFGGQASSGTTGGPVSLALDQLTVTAGVSLRDFVGRFDAQRGFSGQFTARVNGGTAIRGAVAPSNGRTAVRVLSDDAGGVVRSAGLAQNTAGGALDLVLLPTGAEGSFDGTLTVRGGLRVRDAPTMAALLDAISVVGLLQQLDGQGLAFDEIDARFRLTPTQLIVTQASAVGPGLGISLDGIYTLASKQLDFQGVVSPFYLVNAIGEIFTRRGEGLIGFNFTVQGHADRPQVGVNPLSALTPGMFRDLFRRPPPVVGQ